MKRLFCWLFGHHTVTFLTIEVSTGRLSVGGACLRCYDQAMQPIRHTMPGGGDA